MTATSLYRIDGHLSELLARREILLENGGELAGIDEELARYVALKVTSRDGVRVMRDTYREAKALAAETKAEGKLNKEASAMYTARCDLIEELAGKVMLVTGKTVLEAPTGRFLLKANGGKLPVLVQGAAMVPVEYCVFEGTVGGEAYAILQKLMPSWLQRADVKLERKPMLNKIGADLEQNIGVPGCSLGVRGEHVEVK